MSGYVTGQGGGFLGAFALGVVLVSLLFAAGAAAESLRRWLARRARL